MKQIFAVALGILTAIGGFVDIGDLVTNAQVGARFGLALGWVVVAGIIGICVFAEMSGRVAAVSQRATFDIVRERLGPRMGMANLVASVAVTPPTDVWLSRSSGARCRPGGGVGAFRLGAGGGAFRLGAGGGAFRPGGGVAAFRLRRGGLSQSGHAKDQIARRER